MKKQREAIIFGIGDTVLVKWTKKEGIITSDLSGRYLVSTESPSGEPRIYELRPEEIKLIEKGAKK